LRDPDYRIENVAVTDEHVANVKAVVKWEKARREKSKKGTPATAPTPAKTPPRAAGTGSRD
jgi:hypothetical protein